LFFHEKKEKYSIAELSTMLSTDPETAFANLYKSKKKDSANYILGNYYRENKEFDTARYYYKQAIATSNLPAAYSTLGEMYVKGELKDSMSNEIGYVLLKRADSLMKADTNAYYWLGNIVSSKARFAQDSSVYVWVGDIVSTEGHFMRTGHPIEIALFDEAEKWYTKGYKKGSLSCGYQLAFLYLRDKPDVKTAFRYMKEAAEKNRPLAQFYLSHMLEHGNGVAMDKDEADRWFRLFLKNADPDDLVFMGSKCYYGETNLDRGYDLEKDCIKALAIYNAAESKFGQLSNEYKKEEAYLNLGLLYENGCDNAVKADLQKAIEYYKKGAAMFDPAAESQLQRLKVKY
ncbi:MAG: tetratricopeptide repeat protein, partial [Chitinophagaceae bacterium]